MDYISRVAMALCLVASYAAAQPPQCTENIHCDADSYCDASAHCVECIECKNFNRVSPVAASSRTCVMSVFDCGSCLKGYFEDRLSEAFPTCVTTPPRVDGTGSPPDGAVAWQLPVMCVLLAIVVVAAVFGIYFMFRRSKFITTAMRTSFRASVVNRAAPSAPPQPPPPPYNNVVPPASRDKLHHEMEITANGSAASPAQGYGRRGDSAARPAGAGPGAGAGSPPPYSPRDEDAESRRLLKPDSPRRRGRRAHAVRNEAAACYNPGVGYIDRPLSAPHQDDDENTMPSRWTPYAAENSVDGEEGSSPRVQEETVASPWTPAAAAASAPNGRVPRNGEPAEAEGGAAGAGGGGAPGAPLSLAEQVRRERGTVLLRPPTYRDAEPSEHAPPGPDAARGAGGAGGAPPPVAPTPTPTTTTTTTTDSNIYILINNTNQQLSF